MRWGEGAECGDLNGAERVRGYRLNEGGGGVKREEGVPKI